MSPTPHRTASRLRRPAAVLLGLGLVTATGALTWWGTATPVLPSTAVGAVAQPAPQSETVYVCPAGPADTIGAVEHGQTTSTTALTLLTRGSNATWDGQRLTAGGTTVLEGADGGTLVVGPGPQGAASAAGVVTTVTAEGDLRGLSTASCVPPQAVAWIVGGSAAPGASSELRLSNPGTTTVTATVTLYGATGEVDTATGNLVTVPAGETVRVLLEAATSQERLALSVEADGGSLAAVLVTESLDGETAAGVDMLTSGAAPATDLTVPGVLLTEPSAQGQAADETTGATSSDTPVLRVANPGDGPATVTVSTIGADGETPLPGATALVVDPGAVFDVSLAGIAPGAYGIRLSSDTPVTGAVRLVRSAGEHPERSGALVHDVAWAQAQTAAATRSGAVAVPQGQDLSHTLVLTNTASADTTVTLSAQDGTRLAEVSVPGSTTVSLDLAELEDEAPRVIALSAGEGAEVVSALVTTIDTEGEAAGTLIGVLTPVTDAASASARQLLLR